MGCCLALSALLNPALSLPHAAHRSRPALQNRACATGDGTCSGAAGAARTRHGFSTVVGRLRGGGFSELSASEDAIAVEERQRHQRWVDFNGPTAESEDSPEALKAAIERLAEERRDTMSAGQWTRTKGSTYSVLWDVEAWDEHISTRRYWRHLCYWYRSTTAKKVYPVAFALTAWAALVCWVKSHVHEVTMPMAPLTLVSCAVSLLLTLRTNQSLTRLLEARQAWGRLGMHSRVLTGIIATRVYPVSPAAALLCGRLICSIGWCTKAALVPCNAGAGGGGKIDVDALNALLPPEEAKWVSGQHKPNLAALDRIGHLMRAIAEDSAYSKRHLAAEPHRIALDMIVQLDADISMCERILSSPVPPVYTRFTSRILMTWLACVPLALGGLHMPDLTIILGTFLTSFIIIGIDQVAIEIEEPMRLLPLAQLCKSANKDCVSRLVPHPPMPFTQSLAAR